MTNDQRTAAAHAKINLGLEILSKRSDGYHELSTIFCPIDLADDIRVEQTGGSIGLTATGIRIPTDGTNLCVRAAESLRMLSSSGNGARIEVHKRIPVGAGLGGGSSDAACVLRSLNALWDLGCSDADLAAIGARLGADVPYFLTGGLCHATGIGERLESLDVRLPFWIVTVVPPEHVSTRWAYGQIRPRDRSSSTLKESFLGAAGDLDALEEILQNDFEAVVLPAFPEVRKVRSILTENGLSCVRMSGSGSAVFGLCTAEAAARQAAGSFAPPYIVSLTPPTRP